MRGLGSNHAHRAAPSAVIVDSQSVKTTEKGGPRGYDGGKRVTGRQRHLLVDTQGTIVAVVVHPADVQDRDGAYAVLERASDQTMRVAHLWADAAHRGTFARWVAAAWGWTIAIGRRTPDAIGFTVQPRRWVVERTFGWLGRCRRLSKDYEEDPATSETWIALVVRMMFAILGLTG